MFLHGRPMLMIASLAGSMSSGYFRCLFKVKLKLPEQISVFYVGYDRGGWKRLMVSHHPVKFFKGYA